MGAITKTERYWKLMAIVSTLIALFIVGVVGKNYYDRMQVEKQAAPHLSGKFFNVSTRSKNELVAFMRREESVVGISTVSISLVSNRRQVTFFQSENPDFQQVWETNMTTRTRLPEVFSRTPQYNSRIAKIMNGNFDCRRTADTMIAILYAAQDYAEIVCAISVPPSFDESADFIGYINIFMKRTPTDSEKARLAKEAVLLSATIYHRDVSPYE